MLTASVFGYVAMVGLGLVLGLIGAGGSILVVPILVYLFGIPATEATGYSLLIVGASALVGALEYLRRRQSSPRMAFIFGAPAVVGVYATRRWLFPAIPDPVFETAAFALPKDDAVMVLFAVFMLIAAFSMIRGRKGGLGTEAGEERLNIPVILGLGLVVGIFTGLVGAGGGFMILPVLVLMGGLPMKVAIGTDLMIIAAKSLLGFVGEAQAAAIDWGFVGMVLILPLVGIAIGTLLNRRVPAHRLQTAFGWFVLIMGTYIVAREVLFA
ncbi:MAG: sulfite exporter TauE/SafE family protein [Gemmatimonadota bacterium]|nr:sulfite exporter TauE/SafE family protein [Gemmatimonadota bacterium]